MSDNRKFYGCLIFENRLLQADGNTFENLFFSIMIKHFPEFKKVKPYGKIGDEKNDGFIESEGKFYALYGPENISKHATVTYAQSKIEIDINGLISHWNSTYKLKEIFFVINDKNYGLPPQVHKTIQTLNNKYSTLTISLLTYVDIVNLFEQLDITKMQRILGSVIPSDTEIDLIEFEALHQIVTHLLKNWPPPQLKDSESWKEFDEKVKINHITQTGYLLDRGSHCVGTVEKFLRINVSYKVTVIRDIFVSVYEQSKIVIPDTHEYYSDSRLLYVLEHASPDTNNAAIENAMIGLIAYFFEKCDIFETEKTETP